MNDTETELRRVKAILDKARIVGKEMRKMVAKAQRDFERAQDDWMLRVQCSVILTMVTKCCDLLNETLEGIDAVPSPEQDQEKDNDSHLR